MSTKGKLESMITVPVGGWTMRVTDDGAGSPHDISFTAGDTYYWSTADSEANSLVDDLAAKLNAESDSAGTYSVTLSNTTGKITITLAGAGDFGITVSQWSADFRLLCGFPNSNQSGAATYTGSLHALGLWLPDCPFETPFGVDDLGWDEYDAATTEAPGDGGGVVTTAYNRRQVLALRWSWITDSKARIAAASDVNGAWETFYRGAIFGEEGWAQAGGPVNWHPDEASTAIGAYKVPIQREMKPMRSLPEFAGYYAIEIPRMVLIP